MKFIYEIWEYRNKTFSFPKRGRVETTTIVVLTFWLRNYCFLSVKENSQSQRIAISVADSDFIPDPNFSIPDPGSRVKTIPDTGSGSASKNLSIFNPTNCYCALRNMIRDVHPESGSWFFTHPGSWIQGSKRHRIPDPATLIVMIWYSCWLELLNTKITLEHTAVWSLDECTGGRLRKVAHSRTDNPPPRNAAASSCVCMIKYNLKYRTEPDNQKIFVVRCSVAKWVALCLSNDTIGPINTESRPRREDR